MQAFVAGALAGVVLSATTSYLVTGRLFHRFQAKTPDTWRSESWHRHAMAMLGQAVAGMMMGAVFVAAGSPGIGSGLIPLAVGVWGTLAAFVLVMAIYVRWHFGFVLGLILDWLLFVFGVFGVVHGLLGAPSASSALFWRTPSRLKRRIGVPAGSISTGWSAAMTLIWGPCRRVPTIWPSTGS